MRVMTPTLVRLRTWCKGFMEGEGGFVFLPLWLGLGRFCEQRKLEKFLMFATLHDTSIIALLRFILFFLQFKFVMLKSND